MPSRAQSATSKASSSAKTRCTGLVDVWATGEAAASLGFAAARLFDELDPIEKQKTAILQGARHPGGRAEVKALRESEQRAIVLLTLNAD